MVYPNLHLGFALRFLLFGQRSGRSLKLLPLVHLMRFPLTHNLPPNTTFFPNLLFFLCYDGGLLVSRLVSSSSSQFSSSFVSELSSSNLSASGNMLRCLVIPLLTEFEFIAQSSVGVLKCTVENSISALDFEFFIDGFIFQ